MIEMDLNHYDVLEKSLSGTRAVDEKTFASLAALGERLGRLKALDSVFDSIEFSPHVNKLRQQRRAVAVV